MCRQAILCEARVLDLGLPRGQHGGRAAVTEAAEVEVSAASPPGAIIFLHAIAGDAGRQGSQSHAEGHVMGCHGCPRI
jgi:hypothetical protein